MLPGCKQYPLFIQYSQYNITVSEEKIQISDSVQKYTW